MWTMASHCEHDRNNKILLKIKLENKGHTKLNVRALWGPVAWLPGAGCREHCKLPQVGHGRAWQPWPVPPPQPGAGQPEGTRAAPAPGIGHLHGEGVRRRLGQEVGLQVRGQGL